MQELNARFHNFLHLYKIMTDKRVVFGLSDNFVEHANEENAVFPEIPYELFV